MTKRSERRCVIGNAPCGEGTGRSKKEAEQNAAKDALGNMKVEI